MGPGLQDYRAPPRTPNVMRFSVFFFGSPNEKNDSKFPPVASWEGLFLASKGWSVAACKSPIAPKDAAVFGAAKSLFASAGVSDAQ